jgi:hypothetical protein
VNLFAAEQNLPFGIAFALIIGIGLLEGIGMLISLSPSNLLDDLIPDFDGDGGLDRVLGWLHLGKVPALVLLLLFLLGYTVRGLGALVAHIIPRDETSSVSEQTLIGRVGVIVGGTARRGLAAQARVRDSHGRSHYLMVEPDLDDDVLEDGTQVLIVSKAGAFHRCIANPHPTLM